MTLSLLFLLCAFALGLLVGGYLTGLIIFGVIMSTLIFPGIGKAAKNPISVAAILLALAALSFALGLVLSGWMTNDVVLYLFVFVSGVFAHWPVIVCIGLFQLWWNPGKYKERKMKESRRRRNQEID